VHGLRSGHRRPRTSLIAGLSDNALIAPLLFDGTCNTELFNQWFGGHLLPVLPPRTIIVLDNASFHKSKITQELAKAAGCILLFLPPYSPDLNPIEQKWANLKQHRKYNHTITLDQLIISYG
jgi:putative transposase